MSSRSTALLIEDMFEAVAKIERYTAGYNFDRFLADDRTTDAVVRNLEIIGEAAARLPLSAREAFSQVEWPKIIGLRNRIVHEYFGVDMEIVWHIIKGDLAELINILEQMRGEMRE
jgi:uncharacterized protein with HEPN domain